VIDIDRGFARIDEGLVHFRKMGEPSASAPPLVLLHASPGSSRGLEPLLTALGGQGTALLAPDTLGHGESVPALPDAPDIAYYADAVLRVLDAMKIDRVTLYGAHTGARIACEAAILAPDRIDRVVLDGIADYPTDLRQRLIDDYAPEMAPDDYGRHLIWAFNFVRDQALHFPWFERDPAHRLMTRAVPDADRLHDATLDVLRAIRSYHKAYRAAFAYPTRARLADCSRPVILLDSESELPSLRAQMADLVAAAPHGRVLPAGRDVEDKARAILSLLA
jgi:pimeloyl-ACP methyl ester carboxylesterase